MKERGINVRLGEFEKDGIVAVNITLLVLSRIPNEPLETIVHFDSGTMRITALAIVLVKDAHVSKWNSIAARVTRYR
jgi:hypothetical protein